MTHQCFTATTPLSKAMTNLFDTSSRRSSSEAPTERLMDFGLLTKPQSSATIPRWKYSDWDDSGMSRKASDSTMVLANILRSAI